MKEFVLIRSHQRPVTSAEVAAMVAEGSFKKAAITLGVSVSTLRKFLRDEGYRFTRNTSWQVERLPGMETDGSDPAETSTDEPAGTPAGS